jgi:hypothetical protein
MPKPIRNRSLRPMARSMTGIKSVETEFEFATATVPAQG